MQKIILIVFSVFILVSILLRVVPVLNYNFPFTQDQGRDMLDIRNIVVGRNPTLIGPTTSINGVFLGPFWYYFNSLPFFVSGGDPQSLVYWMITWYILASVVIFAFFYKKKPLYGLLVSILFLSIPTSFYASRYSWNANLMPPFTIFFLISLFALLQKPSFWKAGLLGLMIGIGLQIEAAFGILFLPFTLLVLGLNKCSWKKVLTVLAVFILTLAPQALFEVKNHFLMTKTFLGEYSGETAILINKLSPSEIVPHHFNSYIEIVQGLSNLPAMLNLLLVVVALILALWPNKQKPKFNFQSPTIIACLFLAWSFIFYLLYKYDLKGWFIISLFIPFIFVLGKFFNQLIKGPNKVLSGLGIIVFLFFIGSSLHTQYQIIPQGNYQSQDPSNLKNLLTNIDTVYQNAHNQPFKAYTYVPSVYDFSNNYLFWWYGTKKYGYQPADVAYLPSQPEYIRNNQHYWDKTKPVNQDSLTYLIIEKDKDMPTREDGWLGKFSNTCLIETKTMPWQAEIQIRKACPDKQL